MTRGPRGKRAFLVPGEVWSVRNSQLIRMARKDLSAVAGSDEGLQVEGPAPKQQCPQLDALAVEPVKRIKRQVAHHARLCRDALNEPGAIEVAEEACSSMEARDGEVSANFAQKDFDQATLDDVETPSCVSGSSKLGSLLQPPSSAGAFHGIGRPRRSGRAARPIGGHSARIFIPSTPYSGSVRTGVRLVAGHPLIPRHGERAQRAFGSGSKPDSVPCHPIG